MNISKELGESGAESSGSYGEVNGSSGDTSDDGSGSSNSSGSGSMDVNKESGAESSGSDSQVTFLVKGLAPLVLVARVLSNTLEKVVLKAVAVMVIQKLVAHPVAVLMVGPLILVDRIASISLKYQEKEMLKIYRILMLQVKTVPP